MRKFWLLLSILFIWTCGGGGGSSPTEPETPPIVINLTSLDGQAQKGPFNNGTAINIAELTSALSPTGRNFSSAITDNTGRFAVANVQLESPYVELRANGYYFNEVSNEISSGQLTLFALSNLTGKTSLNVNIITHLEKNRMVTLMSGDSPKTFAQAKLQAQEEVFAVFDYSRANVPESELLDISQGGAANGKLLAMSAIIQGDLTVGQMSQLLANISTDIASDGTLDDASLRATLINNSKNLDMAEIRSNLVAHYSSLGVSATIPDFETEINQFLKPPVAQDMSASTAEDTAINITLAGSDPEGESLTYTILEVNNATVTLNGNVANYAPDTNFNGTDTFTYYANDGTSDSNVATVTMTVSAEDDEPNTIDVATTTDEDVAVTVSLSAEEYDGENYSFGIIANPSNGTVSVSGSTATYTPNQDWNGTDTFTFEATDDRIMFGKRNVATATITVNPINDAPASSEVSGSSDEDTAIDIALSATDVDQDNLTYIIVSDVSNGTTSISGSTLTYTPNQDWNGTDTFTYKVNDGIVDSNTSNGTITIASINDAPIANDVTISTNETRFISLDITLDATDVDGDNLTYTIVSDVSNGTTALDGNVVTYVPTTDWNGNETFTYKANDGMVDSNTSTVTITVNAVNDAAVAEDKSVSMDEDWQGDGTQYYPMKLIASDIDNTSLTFTVVSNPTNGDLGNGFYTNAGSGANADSIAYKPNANWNGTDTFTYKVNDGTDDSNTATVTITVNAINDAPTTADIAITMDENRSARMIGIELQGSDVEGDDLTYSVVSDASNGSTDPISSSYLHYFPNDDWNGTETITYKANDGSLDSNTSTITVTVTSVNDAPTVTAGFISTNEDAAATLDLSTLTNDVDGDALTYDMPTGPSNGTASISGTTATYTPDSNWNGTDTFTYEVYDGIADVVVETVTITVNAVNDVPVASDVSVSTNEDTAKTFNLVGTDIEGANDGGSHVVTYSIVSNPSNGSLSNIDAPTVNGASITYTPTANWNGIDTFTYKVNDDTIDSNTATVTITVAAVNDAPVTANQAVSATEDIAKTFTLSVSDVEYDTEALGSLNAIIVSNPSNGSISTTENEIFVTYTPNANWNGTDTFTYKANDGTVDSNTSTVTVTVAAVNDAPVSSAVSVSANEDIAKAITLSGTDVEGSSLTYSIVSNPSNGSLGSLSGTSLTYTPDADWYGTDTFTYKANDGTVDSNTATVTVTVNSIPEYNTYPDLRSNVATDEFFSDIVYNESTGGYLVTGSVRQQSSNNESDWGMIYLETDASLASTNYQEISISSGVRSTTSLSPSSSRSVHGYHISERSENGNFLVTHGQDYLWSISDGAITAYQKISQTWDFSGDSTYDKIDYVRSSYQASDGGYVIYGTIGLRSNPGASGGKYPVIAKTDASLNLQYYKVLTPFISNLVYSGQAHGMVQDNDNNNEYYLVAERYLAGGGTNNRGLDLYVVTDTGSSFTLNEKSGGSYNDGSMTYDNDMMVYQPGDSGSDSEFTVYHNDELRRYNMPEWDGESFGNNVNVTLKTTFSTSNYKDNSNPYAELVQGNNVMYLVTTINVDGDDNIKVVKLSESLGIVWEKTFDVTGLGHQDYLGGATSINLGSNSTGIAITGSTRSDGNDDWDGFIVLMDDTGNRIY